MNLQTMKSGVFSHFSHFAGKVYPVSFTVYLTVEQAAGEKRMKKEMVTPVCPQGTTLGFNMDLNDRKMRKGKYV